MKLIAQVRLYPTKDQHAALKQTLETANAACDYISARAFDAQVFHRYGMQNLTYYDVRARFDLSAQMVIRCLAKVAERLQARPQDASYLQAAGQHRLRRPYPVVVHRPYRGVDLDG